MTSRFDIKELSEEVVEEMNTVLKEKQSILYNHFGDISILELDKNMIKNIFINLLSNASKYSFEGRKIVFTTSIHEHNLDIVVTDEGIGIPEDDKPHLFSRFFRAHNAQNIQGTGLGLNIVKKYIELLNGKINYISELNKGTTFTITIPFLTQ
jgi:signal transduction histidine kinase